MVASRGPPRGCIVVNGWYPGGEGGTDAVPPPPPERGRGLRGVGVPVALGRLIVAGRAHDHHHDLAAAERRRCPLGGEHLGRVAAGTAVEHVRRFVCGERVQAVVYTAR